jgi:anthranilate 1,2-dioxygenase small subunit
MRNYEVGLQVDELQMNYISALDGKDMDAWIGCFTGSGSYICTTSENEAEGLPIALMMDDCHDRLKDRAKFITEVWAGTFEDYLTRHFVQRLLCVEDESDYRVISNFLVTYTTAAGRSEVLVSGQYLDRVQVNGKSALFCSKRAVLDTTITPRYLVYPV